MKLSTLFPFAGGLAAGYVLGAAAGRKRYQQIKETATRLVQHPKVQETVFDLANQAKANSGRLPQQAATLVNTAATKVQDQMTQPAAPDAAAAPEAPQNGVDNPRGDASSGAPVTGSALVDDLPPVVVPPTYS